MITCLVLLSVTISCGSFSESYAKNDQGSEAGIPSAVHGDGSGYSYWGHIPARADSVTAVFVQPPKPLWEKSALVPYSIVKFPFSVVATGLKATIIFMDERRILERVRRLANYPVGPYLVGLRTEFDGLAGLGGGFTVTNPSFLGKGNLLKLRWRSTITGTHRGSLGIHARRERPTNYLLGAGYRLQPNARYFGDGPGAAESMESFYTQEVSWAGLSVRRKIVSSVSAELLALYSGVGTRGPAEEEDVPIDERFERPPAGYRDRSAGVTVSLSLTRDTTRETGRPDRGNLQSLKASRFQETGEGDAAFWTFRGDVQQFLPLWNSKQSLALRAHMTWLKTDEWKDVPFQRYVTNDDPDLFRGYRDFRWRGRGITALTVEYRWPIWALTCADGPGADAYLFTDMGQVFNDFDELSSDNVTHSYGFGIRLVGWGDFLGRVEVGWSEEETVFRVGGEQIFQYAKGGLIHGREQVAIR